MEKKQFALKPDAQGFDEVRITTVPRYKQSYLSGNEWRISGKCQLLRKGKVVYEFSMSNVQNCANALPFYIMRAGDEGYGYYGGGEDGKCDQEGCSKPWAVLYRLKKLFCDEPHKHQGETPTHPLHRQFCDDHAKRGDNSFDDSDANYERVL